MKFTYRWGQRPLDGFTIKRGLGQGGFGEVYFAVSDGGKEVALKLIRGHSDTELRGIANCLNLKHPHLVHLYDLRTDGEGNKWLVMEYVHGEPMSGLLNRNPHGLGENQAREFFLQAAKAVAYLHDHAVVHRDIKPGNLFVENGIVKLGDYGLSKSVGGSQHTQSSNVGTIHYMAPEIASGNYSKQIDIYACGVMLYEMLTGEVPFKGESWAEIAIKHQTDNPKLDKVPAGYQAVLEKALDKNAGRRFRDMNEMIAAVEGLAPNAIPMAVSAETAIHNIPKPVVAVAAAVNQPIPSTGTRSELIARTWRGKLSELANAMAITPLPALAAALVWAVFSESLDWPTLGGVYLLTVATAWLVLIPAKLWEGNRHIGYKRFKMAGLGVLLGLVALWLEGSTMPHFFGTEASGKRGWSAMRGTSAEGFFLGYIVYFSAMLFFIRLWVNAERYRTEKFSIWPVAATAFGAWMGLNILGQMTRYPMPANQVIVSLATAAGVIQLVSPWSERPARKPKKLRLQTA